LNDTSESSIWGGESEPARVLMLRSVREKGRTATQATFTKTEEEKDGGKRTWVSLTELSRGQGHPKTIRPELFMKDEPNPFPKD